MEKWKKIMMIAGIIFIVNILIFITLMMIAIVCTIRSNRQDAIFYLLWAIAIDLIITGLRNGLIDSYNNAVDKYENKKKSEEEFFNKYKMNG